MNFPQYVSFTVTNSCNLRCRMCGQWSKQGYVQKRIKSRESQMSLADWKRLVDEVSSYNIKFILVRGGEPFLYPDIIALLEHINIKGIFISVDTNGTLLKKYAADLVRIGKMHITFSVDGTEKIHDTVRTVKGGFKKIKENIAQLLELEKNNVNKISKSICFTISPYSYKALGEMPDVARSMGLSSINIVPYYYFSTAIGKKYEEELQKNFDCRAFSWKGFHHDQSGIDFNIFREQLRNYLSTLGEIYNFPYMDLTENDYQLWFNDPLTPVGSLNCMNIEKLIDIQPDGEANFCVDFPDYSIGNVKQASLKDLWNGARACQFRSYRRKNPLAVCYRCGAKYISEIKE